MYGQQKYTPLPSDNLVKMRWARYNEAINVNDNASAFCVAKYDEEIRKTLPYYEDFYKQVDRFLSNLKIFYKPAVAAAGIMDRKEAGMKREIRTVVYDEDLQIEAYRFEGFVRPFPGHFHEYYVIGYIESGQRALTCKNQEYAVRPGHILIFNPGDSHACVQSDGGSLDYRGFNISRDVMLSLLGELDNKQDLPVFSQNVIFDSETASCLRTLHDLVLSDSREGDKRENLLLLTALLVQKYGQPLPCCIPRYSEEIQRVCRFIQQNHSKRICLDQLCSCAGLSRSTLLRAFTRLKGVTPYRYLENVRVGQAKKLLEQGVPPIEAALQTGFSDQSHFTNYFDRFLGLSPGAYRNIFSRKK